MTAKLWAWVTIAAFAITVFVAIALLLFDASSFPVLLLALILGVVLAVVVPLLVRFVLHLGRHHPRFTVISLVLVVISLTALAYARTLHSGVTALPAASVAAMGPGEGTVTTYRAVVAPEQPSSDSFMIEENAAVDAESQSGQTFTAHYHATQTIMSSQVGFALRRVTFTPFHLATSGLLQFRTRPPHRRTRSSITVERFCDPSCPNSTVRLDLPTDAFYRAAGTTAQATQQPISWTADQPDAGITFYYIPASYRPLRPILDKFIGTTSIQQGVLIALGVVLAFLFSFGSALWLGLKATAIAFAQGRITNVLDHVEHRGPQPSSPTAPIAPAAETKQQSVPAPTSPAADTQTPSPGAPTVVELGAVFAWPIAAVMVAFVLRSGLVTALRETRRAPPESNGKRSR